MASLWRRAMVYLGLQDDDELDYGGEYESYGEYADHETDDARGHDHREPPEHRDSGTVRTSRDPGHDSAHQEPGGRGGREDPSGVSIPRPAVVRTTGPTTAARVHIVEPQGFNDAQEVGDRLKANQPVILNLQGLTRDLQRRLIDFSSGLAYAVGGSMARVAEQVFLLTPSNVEVSQEEKERLQARGLYRA
jgi:cell division inhibitor SepF